MLVYPTVDSGLTITCHIICVTADGRSVKMTLVALLTVMLASCLVQLVYSDCSASQIATVQSQFQATFGSNEARLRQFAEDENKRSVRRVCSVLFTAYVIIIIIIIIINIIILGVDSMRPIDFKPYSTEWAKKNCTRFSLQ